MLLRFFRINDPYRLLAVFILMVLIALGFFTDPAGTTLDELKAMVLGEALNSGKSLYTQVHTTEAPLAAWLYGWEEWLFGRSLTARHVLAFLLIFFQGAYFAILLISNKAQGESTYLPAFLFGVICFFSFDMLVLSPELIASTILLLALNNLFKEVEFRAQRDDTLLTLGLYLGMATLLVFTYAVFLPGTIIILAVFTRLSVRKTLLLIFGFCLPHLLLATAYYFNDNFEFLWSSYYTQVTWFAENRLSLNAMFYLSVIPIGYFLLSLVMLNREARLTKYQSQLLQIMFLWLLIAAAEIALAGNMAPHRVITFAPSFAYFISHFLLLIRRKWLGELLLWVFAGGIVLIAYLARYNKTDRIDYSKLFYSKVNSAPVNKRILVLDEQWGYFENNKPATGFYDWRISGCYFSGTDYFQYVVLLDKAFKADMPEVIFDPHQVLPAVFKRIPSLEKNYSKQGAAYYLKTIRN
ncbi:MAG: hypothetical protein KIT62_09610 [Cyclobacteriaceae bacterium]|nr:hypothetical protein [Cyclobacteriaceae bacterium]